MYIAEVTVVQQPTSNMYSSHFVITRCMCIARCAHLSALVAELLHFMKLFYTSDKNIDSFHCRAFGKTVLIKSSEQVQYLMLSVQC